jgi:hypothetical protein
MYKFRFLKTACLITVFGLAMMNVGAQTLTLKATEPLYFGDGLCTDGTYARNPNSYTGGDVLLYDAKGKEVWRTTVKAGEKPNLSKLPKGEYRLRHGHRIIPIKKVK